LVAVVCFWSHSVQRRAHRGNFFTDAAKESAALQIFVLA
jgi:hypothetical protein